MRQILQAQNEMNLQVVEAEKATKVEAWKALHILARMPLFIKLTAVLMLLAAVLSVWWYGRVM